MSSFIHNSAGANTNLAASTESAIKVSTSGLRVSPTNPVLRYSGDHSMTGFLHQTEISPERSEELNFSVKQISQKETDLRNSLKRMAITAAKTLFSPPAKKTCDPLRTSSFDMLSLKSPNSPLIGSASNPTTYTVVDLLEGSYRSQVKREFSELTNKSSLFNSPQHSSVRGKSAFNEQLNRYSDILPYDNNAVTVGSNNRYFNGSPVQFSDHGPKYIATQAPTPQTFSDFWNVVFDSNTDTIVMLTKTLENRRVKAHVYWPDSVNDPEIFHNQSNPQDPSVQVSLIDSNQENDFIIRTFEVKKGDQAKRVKHFHFTEWPDNGVADVNKFNALLASVRETHETGPLIVHCSAGVGRAGTFITTDALQHELAQGNEEIDVANTVHTLRSQRKHSVQTEEQYELIYNALRDFLNAKKV